MLLVSMTTTLTVGVLAGGEEFFRADGLMVDNLFFSVEVFQPPTKWLSKSCSSKSLLLAYSTSAFELSSSWSKTVKGIQLTFSKLKPNNSQNVLNLVLPDKNGTLYVTAKSQKFLGFLRVLPPAQQENPLPYPTLSVFKKTFNFGVPDQKAPILTIGQSSIDLMFSDPRDITGKNCLQARVIIPVLSRSVAGG
jgi:hypothetical protein